MFAWFLIVQGTTGKPAEGLDFLNGELTPLIVWGALILFLIFPHHRHFGVEGRFFLLKVFKRIFLSTIRGPSALVSKEIILLIVFRLNGVYYS
jgi:hypothetical protein